METELTEIINVRIGEQQSNQIKEIVKEIRTEEGITDDDVVYYVAVEKLKQEGEKRKFEYGRELVQLSLKLDLDAAKTEIAKKYLNTKQGMFDISEFTLELTKPESRELLGQQKQIAKSRLEAQERFSKLLTRSS